MHKIHDVIIIGGGAIGLASAYEVAKSGKDVMLLERNNLYNQAGSSHSADMARMYRTMYTEDFMADLAYKSLGIWDELERDAGDNNLRLMTGLLNFGDPDYGKGGPEGTLLDPIKNLKRLGMAYTIYETPEEIEAKFPFKNLPQHFKGVFAPDNGIINVPLLLRTFTRLALSYGAQIRANHQVHKVTPKTNQHGDKYWHIKATYTDPRSGKVEEHTHSATKIIIACGAYANHILKPSFGFQLRLNIWEMVASYWGMDPGPRGTRFPCMWFQFAKDLVTTPSSTTGKIEKKSQLFYGFPALPWGPPNIARISVDDATLQITDPDHRHPTVISPDDIGNTQEFVKEHVMGVDGTTTSFSLAALQTNVYDNMFVLDFIPEQYLQGGAKDSVAIFTAGWAMKFAPLLGRALKQLVIDGASEYALEEFKITRHGDGKDETIILPPTTSHQREMELVGDAGSATVPRGSTAETHTASWQERKAGGSSMRAQ